jgi:hypothetical protein
MTLDSKFTAFTCRATATALGMVPLPPDSAPGRAVSGAPATPGNKTVRAGRQVASFRSRKGCRWLAELGRGFETAAAVPSVPPGTRRS